MNCFFPCTMLVELIQTVELDDFVLHLQKDKYKDKHVSVSSWGEKTLREIHERISADPRPSPCSAGLFY